MICSNILGGCKGSTENSIPREKPGNVPHKKIKRRREVDNILFTILILKMGKVLSPKIAEKDY